MNSKNIILSAIILAAFIGCGSDKKNNNVSNGVQLPEGETKITTIEENFTLKSIVLPSSASEVVCKEMGTLLMPAVTKEMTVEEYLSLTIKKNWDELRNIDTSTAKGLYGCVANEIKKHLKKEE